MNKPLILVVEDDPSIRNLITTTLKTNDYRYVVAPSGSTAIMEATSHNPEIILLDLGLPDMDGVQVIQTVRSWSNAPIIVISARSEDNDKIHALDAGADDYLTKPFSVEELLARLRVTQRRLSLMTAEMFTASSVFVNGKLKVDYVGGCAYLDENELHLTPMEYKLLCLLSKNVGKVLTHTFITQNIWGRSWDNDVASAGIYGNTAEKAGANRGVPAIHPNTYWCGLPYDKSRIILCGRPVFTDASDVQHTELKLMPNHRLNLRSLRTFLTVDDETFERLQKRFESMVR